MPSSQTLAAINSVLVAVSGLLILSGLLAIRRGERPRHMRSMAAATALLALFLTLYAIRFLNYGITPFPGPAWGKWIYYPVMASHVLLATVSTPLVLWTLLFARRSQWERHRRLGRRTYPLWIYVAATGPLVYLMLYHLF